MGRALCVKCDVCGWSYGIVDEDERSQLMVVAEVWRLHVVVVAPARKQAGNPVFVEI